MAKKINKIEYEGIYRAASKTFGFVLIDKETNEEVYVAAKDSMHAMNDDKVLIKIISSGSAQKKQEGKVVKILERNSDIIVGYFEPSKSFGFVRPINKKIGFDIHIEKKYFSKAVKDSIVLAKLLNVKNENDNPEGMIMDVIGHKDDPNDEITAIVKDYKIKDVFDYDTMEEADNVAIPLTENDLIGRKDLRDKCFITIDGEDTKDIDDAIYLEKLQNGNVKLYVSIADVSHYVKEDKAIDREALKRGNSVYLLDRVIPMIPHVLSNGMCSLNPHEDRLCMTCEMEYDKSGKQVAHEIYEGVMNSHRRMTYTEVQAILNNEYTNDLSFEKDDLPPEIKDMIFDMIELSRVLRKKRDDRGAINFNIKETYIDVDENLRPICIKEKKRIESNELIEDFMVAANETVAEEYFYREVPFIYRTHEECDEEKIRTLINLVMALGINFKVHKKMTSLDMQKLLSLVKGTPCQYVIEKMALRSMNQARYTKEELGHFALAAKYYSHFTSPIRRYSDLQIHRIMKEVIENKFTEGRKNHYENILDDVAYHISKTERTAIDCERDIDDLKKCQYMSDKIGEIYDGMISGLTNFGIFVELENTIEGLVSFRDMKDDRYVFNEERYYVYGERAGKTFHFGDKVKVKLIKVSEEIRAIDFAFM